MSRSAPPALSPAIAPPTLSVVAFSFPSFEALIAFLLLPVDRAESGVVAHIEWVFLRRVRTDEPRIEAVQPRQSIRRHEVVVPRDDEADAPARAYQLRGGYGRRLWRLGHRLHPLRL